MKHYPFIAFACLLFSIFSIQPISAQTLVDENAKLIEELKMTEWPGDSLAEAGVIFDKGETIFKSEVYNGDYKIFFSRSTKVKILKPSGLGYSEIEIPFYYNKNNSERIDSINARVYNFENEQIQLTELDASQIYEETIDSHYKLKKFALPNVKVGSVIEYSYTLVSPYKFNLPSWEFQWQIPISKSSLKVSFKTGYNYAFFIQNENKFGKVETLVDSITDKYSKKYIYNFESTNLPALRDEENSTTSKDFIPKLNSQLYNVIMYGQRTNIITTWGEMTKGLMKDESFGGYLSDSKKEARHKIDFNPLLDTVANLKLAIDHIKKRYTWNHNYSIEASKTVKAFTTQKTGNSADINLYAIGLLNAMGINAKPVLISTRKHGKILTDFPFLNAFNHSLIYVKIANQHYLCDATDVYYPFETIPIECINDEGYLIDNKAPDTWLTLRNSKVSDWNKLFEMSINIDDDELTANFSSTTSNYYAVNLRKKYVNDNTEFRKWLLGELESSEIKVENLEDFDKRFTVKTTITVPLERSGNLIFVNPFLTLCDQKNMFKAESRNFPIDLTYNMRHNFVTHLKIPDGYKTKSIPETLTFDDPLIRFSYVAKETNNGIDVSGTYYFTKSIYPAEDYLKLKELFNTIVSKLNQSIVLEQTDMK